jgi:hypothetical protein
MKIIQYRQPSDVMGAPLNVSSADAVAKVATLSSDMRLFAGTFVRWYKDAPKTEDGRILAQQIADLNNQVRELSRLVNQPSFLERFTTLAWNVYDRARTYQERLRVYGQRFAALSGKKAPPMASNIQAPPQPWSTGETLMFAGLGVGALAAFAHMFRRGR